MTLSDAQAASLFKIVDEYFRGQLKLVFLACVADGISRARECFVFACGTPKIIRRAALPTKANQVARD